MSLKKFTQTIWRWSLLVDLILAGAGLCLYLYYFHVVRAADVVYVFLCLALVAGIVLHIVVLLGLLLVAAVKRRSAEASLLAVHAVVLGLLAYGLFLPMWLIMGVPAV